MKAFGPTRMRIPDTVPRPILVVARTRPGSGYRRAGSVRGVVVLADSRPGPRLSRRPQSRSRTDPGRPVLGFLLLAILTLAATRIVRSSTPSNAWIPLAIGGGLAVVGAGILLARWASAARLVRSPGSFIVVGRDHRLDLETIDRVTASWSDRERFDTLQRAGQDPRWGRWTAAGMRERHEDDRYA
ncbi:hypothetical protein GA0111570_103297 [Raineyella antarctica]|uniref:Uncharacterized protein n=1 Tax=Raineyella antarctica TaxID=1577474 RepID=A0A1G6GIE7_9ACTN|nr:hypothetical protein [Raineyella antarctica]SDB81525.1 hypothetical protein GA0111570_103297 [Raineyella antarctica]